MAEHCIDRPWRAARSRALLSAAALACAVLCLALCACGGPSPAAHAPQAQDQPAAEYVIGPGDVLSVFVYEAPPLSVTDLPVRPDGRISVPLAPDIVAAGRTSSQLGADIAARLKTYVQNPNVTVMVHTFQGPADRQIRVIGQAVDPLAIPYRENMSVLDVMIATKGLTKFAAGNRAFILRGSGAAQTKLPVRLSDLIKDGDISQNVTMRPGDTLIIPETFF